MVADVILGVTIDTPIWIKDLKLNFSDNIYVIDYDYSGEPFMINGVTYLSNVDAKEFLKNFDSVSFYKSLYIYPGMRNSRSSINNKGKDSLN